MKHMDCTRPASSLQGEAANARVDGVGKIAVLRANALGDFIFSLPALHALRAAYPEAEITLLGRAWHREFLANRPSPVDRVAEVPCYRGVHDPVPGSREDPAEIEGFFREMQLEQFDIAVQMHGGGLHSNPFVAEMGARLTVGMQAPGAPPLDRTVSHVFYHSEVLRCLELVSLVGARPVRLQPSLAVTDCDLNEADECLSGKQPFAVLHPGAGDLRRRWPAAGFAALGDAIAERGLFVVVTGVGEERELAGEVCGRMKAEGLNAAGQLSLSGLAGLLSQARIVISNDSGPLHLARAVGAPTIGLYWVGNAINAGPVSIRRNRVLLSWRLDCPVCGANCIRSSCSHRESFIADIPVADVLGAVEDLLLLGE